VLISKQFSPSRALAHIAAPAILSSLFVLPFMILEIANRRGFQEDFPIALFGLLWLLPLSFILILTPIVRRRQAEHSKTARPLGPLLRVVVLIFIAALWAGVVFDQMPCFLGVPYCD
jgi:hypothetical protein